MFGGARLMPSSLAPRNNAFSCNTFNPLPGARSHWRTWLQATSSPRSERKGRVTRNQTKFSCRMNPGGPPAETYVYERKYLWRHSR